MALQVQQGLSLEEPIISALPGFRQREGAARNVASLALQAEPLEMRTIEQELQVRQRTVCITLREKRVNFLAGKRSTHRLALRGGPDGFLVVRAIG